MTHLIFSYSKQKPLQSYNFITCHLIFHPLPTSEVMLYSLFCSVATHSTRPRKTTKLCVGKADTWMVELASPSHWFETEISHKIPSQYPHTSSYFILVTNVFESGVTNLVNDFDIKFNQISIHQLVFPMNYLSNMLLTPQACCNLPLMWEEKRRRNTSSPRIPQSETRNFHL